MNKLIKFSSLAIIALAATFSFTSCDDDIQQDTISEQSFLQCYAVVSDLQTGIVTSVEEPITIKLTLNWNKAIADLQITGLSDYSRITMNNVPWTINQQSGWSEIDADIVNANNTGGQLLAVSDFEMEWLDRLDLAEYLSNYDPALEFSFTVDNRYVISGSRAPFYMTGTTVANSPAGEAFTNQISLYATAIDYKNRTATITIKGAKFAQGMPALDIELPNIPVTFDDDGDVEMQADNLIPTMNGAQVPSFPISNLYGKIEPGDDMELKFNCSFAGANYSVVATLDFTSYVDVIGQLEPFN